ncbi:MAG: Jag N-terminal domain-containing protein [Candidatus Cloacimonetes bacterium]|nr:Jag N-terminal domain-containing protein [Candidatus Cloacimonadota bacterium]
MKTIKKYGKDIQKIINDFKVENNLDEFDFAFQVIQEPEKGFLGFLGGKKGIVQFTVNNVNEDIQEYIKEFSVYAQVTYDSINIINSEKYIHVELNGVSDPGFFIGKDGKFLQSLQYLLTQTFSQKDPRNRPIILDIEGYKERQEQIMTKKIKILVSQALKTKKAITLDPMSASQRRVVHQALKGVKDIKTMTIGEGTMKRIVLNPSKTIEPLKKKLPPKKNWEANKKIVKNTTE